MSNVVSAYAFDQFLLDPSNRTLFIDGETVAVPPKTLDALILLLENTGRLLRKEQIHSALWPDAFVEDVTLARVISDLRRILAKHSNVRYIETVSKHGYRFTAIVESVRLEVSPEAPKNNGDQSDADDLTRRAWHAAARWSPTGVLKGLDYARQAIAINPSCAEAHAALAYVYLSAGFGLLPGTDAFPRARMAAKTALELDPQCAPAHAVSGMLKLAFDRDAAGAEELFKRSIELAPNSLPGHFAYSHFLLIVGRFDEALEHAFKAYEIDPLSSPVAFHIASIFYFSGRYEKAVGQLLKFEYLDPSFLAAHQMLAVLYARLNQASDALSEAAKATDLSGNRARGKATLAMVNALLGRREEAQAVLQEILARPEVPGSRSSYSLAAIYSYLTERDAAFECLDQACKEADGALIYFRYDPHFIELRDDERFTKIIRRIGLQTE